MLEKSADENNALRTCTIVSTAGLMHVEMQQNAVHALLTSISVAEEVPSDQWVRDFVARHDLSVNNLRIIDNARRLSCEKTRLSDRRSQQSDQRTYSRKLASWFTWVSNQGFFESDRSTASRKAHSRTSRLIMVSTDKNKPWAMLNLKGHINGEPLDPFSWNLPDWATRQPPDFRQRDPAWHIQYFANSFLIFPLKKRDTV